MDLGRGFQMIRTLLLASALAFGLSGCMEVGFGFDDDNSAAASNGCTAEGCPDAPKFCVARGYTPGTPDFQRCVASVEDNLRKGNR
jgi:hypothetical protein